MKAMPNVYPIYLSLQNEEMHAEGELRNNMDDSERVRELQDKVAELKAEVSVEKVLLLIYLNRDVKIPVKDSLKIY